MAINFIIKGRLGNAIFRYFAIAIMCIKTNANYVINKTQSKNCSDNDFINMILNDKFKVGSYNMSGYYQHDAIYRDNMASIKQFINEHPDHYVMTDGVMPGDGNLETFKMMDVIHTPKSFDKNYDYVLHVRLEDFVTHNLFLPVERIIELLKVLQLTNLCIVCKCPVTDFENNYINTIKQFMLINHVEIILEHNDIMTDFYIMKNAKKLICSKSTLSWCAALLSEQIETCYFPEYVTKTATCKYPILNTKLY